MWSAKRDIRHKLIRNRVDVDLIREHVHGFLIAILFYIELSCHLFISNVQNSVRGNFHKRKKKDVRNHDSQPWTDRVVSFEIYPVNEGYKTCFDGILLYFQEGNPYQPAAVWWQMRRKMKNDPVKMISRNINFTWRRSSSGKANAPAGA